jgi:hypothetical protein
MAKPEVIATQFTTLPPAASPWAKAGTAKDINARARKTYFNVVIGFLLL